MSAAPSQSDPPDAEVVDGEVITEPVSLAVARRERRSEVIRPLDPVSLVESFAAYQQLLPQLLEDSDWQGAGTERFVKKSGWRKIATAFDLDVDIVRVHIDRDPTGQPIRAEVWARAIAPSGRSMVADGYCSTSEPRFQKATGRQKLENDLPATAATRAKNRAISDLVGMGAVSAEEVDAGATTTPGLEPLAGWDQRGPSPAKQAFGRVLGPVAGVAWKQIVREHGFMPKPVADAFLAGARLLEREEADVT